MTEKNFVKLSDISMLLFEKQFLVSKGLMQKIRCSIVYDTFILSLEKPKQKNIKNLEKQPTSPTMSEEYVVCVDNKSVKPIKRASSSPSAVDPQHQSSKVKAKHLIKKPRLENKDELRRILILSSEKKVLEI